MLKRVISGIILVIIALITILQGGYLLAGVLLFISLVAYRELMQACKISGEGKRFFSPLELMGDAGIIVFYLILVFVGDGMLLLMEVSMVLIGMMTIYVFTFPAYRAEQVMSALFNVVYAPLMLSCIYMTRNLSYGIYIVWMIFISSWICDTCAYFVGVCIGKHKLAPKLSPHKSIEGAVGGIVGSAVVGGLYGYFVVEQVVSEQNITWIFAIISAAGAVISQIGDLAASAIKRNHDIKDYGKLIPGHGGIMDRFDSVIFTAPVIYLLAFLMIKQI